MPNDRQKIDLTKEKWQNDEKIGAPFRAYLAFLEEVRLCRTVDDFYRLLPAQGRKLVFLGNGPGLQGAFDLFGRFQKEYFQTFLK